MQLLISFPALILDVLFKTSMFVNSYSQNSTPVGIYLLKVNNRNIRTRCEICSKLTIKTLGRGQWRRSGVFIVNFEHVITRWDMSWLFNINWPYGHRDFPRIINWNFPRFALSKFKLNYFKTTERSSPEETNVLSSAILSIKIMTL